jgi:hypothetical protein
MYLHFIKNYNFSFFKLINKKKKRNCIHKWRKRPYLTFSIKLKVNKNIIHFKRYIKINLDLFLFY